MNPAELLAEEARNPQPGIWWLSFAGDDGFLGGCYVDAIGPVSAVTRSHQVGINPGGEVQIFGPLSHAAFWRSAPPGTKIEQLLQLSDIPDAQSWPGREDDE